MTQTMDGITKEQYEAALVRIEELMPRVTDDTPADSEAARELVAQSAIVVSYEKEHYPIPKPTITELRHLSIQKPFGRHTKRAVRKPSIPTGTPVTARLS